MKVKLSSIFPKVQEVVFNGVTIEVRGLTLEHISGLIQEFKSELMAFLAAGKDDPDFSVLILSAPDFVRKIILQGTNLEEDENFSVKNLPMHIQVELLSSVVSQTAPDLKKLSASIQEMTKALIDAKQEKMPLKTQ